MGIVPGRVQPLRPEVGRVLAIQADQGRGEGLRAGRLRGVGIGLVLVGARPGREGRRQEEGGRPRGQGDDEQQGVLGGGSEAEGGVERFPVQAEAQDPEAGEGAAAFRDTVRWV